MNNKRILIQTNQYFTKEKWTDFFKNNHFNTSNNIKIKYTDTNKEFSTLLPTAKYAFSFKLPDIDSVKHLKMLYLGISDIDYADKLELPKNVNIYSSKGLASKLIAEHTLLNALALIRKLPVAAINQHKRKWKQETFFYEKPKLIQNLKIGILGLGNNGKAIAKIFKSLGCWVAGYSNSNKINLNLDAFYSKNQLDKILKISDIIIIALPLREDTYQLLGKKEFQIMGKDSFLINAARGGIINEKELLYALQKDKIKGVALDVFEKEPLHRKSKLWKLPNLIITPHIAGNIHLIIDEIQNDFLNLLKKTMKQ